MSFSSKYTVVKLPEVAPVSRKPTIEDRLRKKMGDAIEVQLKILEAERDGTEYEAGASTGKSGKTRVFWLTTSEGVAFTPRFANEYIFQKGEGIIVENLAALGDLLMDFAIAVQSGEFDARLVEIFNSRKSGRGGKGGGPVIDMPPGLIDVDPSLAQA